MYASVYMYICTYIYIYTYIYTYTHSDKRVVARAMVEWRLHAKAAVSESRARHATIVTASTCGLHAAPLSVARSTVSQGPTLVLIWWLFKLTWQVNLTNDNLSSDLRRGKRTGWQINLSSQLVKLTSLSSGTCHRNRDLWHNTCPGQ